MYVPDVYKEGENDYNSRYPSKPCGNYIPFFSLSVKIFEEEIQPRNCVDTARGYTLE